ncbi:MAG TPA: hypothetical protein VGL10_10270 [Gammaproteobacteria bacterium]
MSEMNNTRNDSALRLGRAIWSRRKWLAILAFVAPFAAVVSLVVAMPDLYRAKATILVQQEPTAAAAMSPAAGAFEARLQGISEQILSRSRLEYLIKRFDLYPELRQHASPEQVLERMRRDIQLERKKVEVSWGPETTVAFTLSYQGWEPQTLAKVVNTLASFYVEENEKLRPRQILGNINGDDAFLQLKQELAELRSRFNDNYPDIIQLKAEIAALENLQREAVRRGMSAAQTLNTTGSQSPTGKVEQQFWILDAAVPPKEAVAPSRARLIIMGLILALGIAGITVLLAEQFDTSFHRLDELWAFTNMPVLASIPRIVTWGDSWRRGLHFSFVSVLTLLGLALLIRAGYFIGQNGEQLVWMLAQRGT